MMELREVEKEEKSTNSEADSMGSLKMNENSRKKKKLLTKIERDITHGNDGKCETINE